MQKIKQMKKTNGPHTNEPLEIKLKMQTLTEKDLESIFGAVEDEEVWHRSQDYLRQIPHAEENFSN
jgi:hypothetical protein